MHKIFATLIAIAALFICSSVSADEKLFPEGITEEERIQFKRSAEYAQEAIDALDAMQTMLMVMNFQDGDCDEVENIEQQAVNGDAKSQFLLGSLYNEGLCVGVNKERAVKWINKAADQGYSSAQFDLGIFYLQGNGVKKNTSIAAKFFLECAKTGEARCQHAIGGLYAIGEGVPKDSGNAVKWLEMAAEQNYEKSLATLAFEYAKGDNFPQDFTKAEIWAKRGAERGLESNQYILAVLLSDESIGRHSPVEAYKWANLAAQSSDEDISKEAKALRDNLQNIMTPKQVVEAQKQSSEWKPISDVDDAPQNNIKLPKITAVGNLNTDMARAKLESLEIPITRLAFFKAIEEDNFEVFDLFIKAGADINTERVMPAGVTPLYWSVDYGASRITNYLLEHGADVNKRNLDNGMTPLVRAISHERWDIVDRLLKLGASAKQTPETHPDHISSILSGTPLSYSLMFDRPALVRRILKRGGSVNELYLYHETPLIHAVRSGYVENAKILVEAGAEIDAMSDHGQTALLICFFDEEQINHRMAELLLKHGAKTKYSRSRTTPLFFAAIRGDGDAIRILSRYGYDINEKYSIPSDNLPMFLEDKRLIEISQNGGTPLMIATIKENYGAAKALIELGANINIKVKGKTKQYTAQVLAEDSGNMMLKDLFLKH